MNCKKNESFKKRFPFTLKQHNFYLTHIRKEEYYTSKMFTLKNKKTLKEKLPFQKSKPKNLVSGANKKTENVASNTEVQTHI